MTNEQIIEGLRCCNNGLCEICPYHEEEFIADCREQNGNDSLDLIRRQKAEIERLIDLINEVGEYNEAWVKDNHDLRVELKTAKSDTIREFAERVERYIDVGHLRPPTEICFSELDVVNIVKRLVKEMTEEQP